MQILRKLQRFVGRKLCGWDDGMKTSNGVGYGRCSDLLNQRSGDWILKLAWAFLWKRSVHARPLLSSYFCVMIEMSFTSCGHTTFVITIPSVKS